MALKLSLKPGERLAINGAVVVNGDRRSSLVVENKARILRENDVMQPEDADSPAKRVYLPIMMMYLDPSTQDEMRPEYEARLMDIVNVITDQEALARCTDIAAHVANGDFYKALAVCRKLIEFEQSRLTDVA